MQDVRTTRAFTSPDPLAGGGEMGALMRATDWANTPVGPVDAWPQSLRTALSILLDTGFPMYIAWGPEFTQFYNDGYRPILGSTKHPALGKSTRETFREIWHIIGPMFAGVMEGRSTTVVDFLLPLDRHGFTEECYFIFSYSPIRQERGEVGGVLVTVTETTERVLGSRRLKTLQDLADRTRNAASPEDACAIAAAVLRENPADMPFAAVYLIDPDGSRARLAGASCLALDAPAAAPHVALANSPWPLERVASSGAPEVLTLDAARRSAVSAVDGAEPTRALIVPVMQQGEGKATAVLVAGVSPRLILDDAYRSFLTLVADHIGTAIAGARALQEVNARAQALAELDRAKTVFFSNVSHEFRTPLTLMLGPTEAALRSPEQALRGNDLQVVHRNELRLLKLVNTLLDFSRIEAGRIEAVYERTDLGTLTADLASVFRSAIERAGLRLVLNVRDVPADVWVDRDMWEKIVLNLLSNAFKHTFEGTITVCVRGVAGGVELSVADTGVGIAADQLERIFERFHRVPSARARTHEGTGIGLALVQELVRLHGGTVTVGSAIEQGTTFRVRLPTGSAHLPAERLSARRLLPSSAIAATAFVEEALRWLPEPAAPAASTGAREVPAAERATPRYRILVVDDNGDMRAYVAALLGREFDVEAAVDGVDAIERFRQRRPDLVLTDIMMPRLDGLGLLAAIRSDPDGGQTPVVLVSARAGEEARIQGLEAGADDYIVKPFSARELVATVRAHATLAAHRREFERRERVLERKAAAASAELDRILSSVEEGIVALDRDLRYIYANPAAERLVALRKEQVLGRTPWEVFPPEVAGTMMPAVERAIATSQMVKYELYVPGSDRWYENRVYPSSGSVSVFFTDITSRKRSEEALARARDAAESANRLKDQFLATLSHELRTPLNAILGYARMLRQDVIPPERRGRVLEIIERNAMAQTQLVEDLLDISRISTGKLRLTLMPLRVAAPLQEALESIRPAADARGVAMEVRLDPAAGTVNADAARLQQVFWNLLSNAVKFTGEGGRITVTLRGEGEGVTVAIADSGVGVAPAFLPHVFEPFRQADGRFSREHGGIGLGLAICKQLIELHGGSIEAASDGLGRGATFTVRLPAHQAAEATADHRDGVEPPLEREASSVAAQAGARGRLRHLDILVVDDDPDACELLRHVFENEAAVVRLAGSADEALREMDARVPDLLVIDLGLPGIDGCELLQTIRLRAPDRGGQVPALAVSAYARQADRARALAAGFRAHVPKPIDAEALVSAVLAGVPA